MKPVCNQFDAEFMFFRGGDSGGKAYFRDAVIDHFANHGKQKNCSVNRDGSALCEM